LASDITQAAKEEFLRHGMVPVMQFDTEMTVVRQDRPHAESKVE